MNIEELIDKLRKNYDAVIVKGYAHYSVTIWDAGEGNYQELELTEGDLIDLYNILNN